MGEFELDIFGKAHLINNKNNIFSETLLIIKNYLTIKIFIFLNKNLLYLKISV